MFIQDKKGISEIISYVLLIVIAVGISILVYNFLIAYIPKGIVEECPDGVNLIVKNINCQGIILQLNLTNKGLWNISAAYLRVGSAGKTVRQLIGSQTALAPYPFIPSLTPDASTNTLFFNIADFGTSPYELEVEPTIISAKTGKPIACAKSIVVQSFPC